MSSRGSLYPEEAAPYGGSPSYRSGSAMTSATSAYGLGSPSEAAVSGRSPSVAVPKSVSAAMASCRGSNAVRNLLYQYNVDPDEAITRAQLSMEFGGTPNRPNTSAASAASTPRNTNYSSG